MNLLRNLHFHRARATSIVMLLSHNMPTAVVGTSAFSSLTGTRWPLLNFVCRHFHITLRCASLGQNIDNNSSSGNLPAVETVKPKHKTDTAAVTTDSLLVKSQLSVAKDILKSDVDSEKTESRIHIDESEREVTVYVANALVKTKAVDLYKIIRRMDSGEVCL